MKNQILRLCFGMAWCLSALVPVHAPAAGASATADHAARRDTRTAAAQTRPSPADTLHVVFFTDIHVTPGNAQDSLFRMAVAEANASDAELVIFGGDLTNTGSDEELEHVYGLMSQLEKPWFTVMGNHETTWSESGCTTFRRIFGHDGRVAHRAGGYLFLGYNCGPYMKMADGVVRTEDLAWLGAQAAGARPGERIVSLCHYPLNKDLTNRQEVVATLKRLGITASLYIGLGVGSVGRIDLRSGKLLWRYDYGQGQAQGRPTLADGKLVFGAWDRQLYCLDAATGRCLWKWNNGRPGVFLSPGHVVPRIAGGKVFIVAPDRAVTCLDLATGRQLWRDNSRKARETTGLGGDGRQFYYKTMDGELAAVDTSADAYRETWCTDLGWGYEYNSCPACVRDGVVYVAGRLGQVAAVREDGTLLWSVKCCNSAGNDFRQAPDGSLWVTFAEGKLFRIP